MSCLVVGVWVTETTASGVAVSGAPCLPTKPPNSDRLLQARTCNSIGLSQTRCRAVPRTCVCVHEQLPPAVEAKVRERQEDRSREARRQTAAPTPSPFDIMQGLHGIQTHYCGHGMVARVGLACVCVGRFFMAWKKWVAAFACMLSTVASPAHSPCVPLDLLPLMWCIAALPCGARRRWCPTP